LKLFLLPFSYHCSTQNIGIRDSGYVIWLPQPSSAIYGALPLTGNPFCKGVHNCHIPYKAPASVPRVHDQTIGASIFRQANGLKDQKETNADQWWSFEDGVYGWMSRGSNQHS